MAENITWNSTYKQEEPTWLNLPDGEHDFTVEDIAFGDHNREGSKIPPCPMAEVTLVFKHPEGGTNKISTRLYLLDQALPTSTGKTWNPIWRLNQFFNSVGASGNTYGEKMSDARGKTGRAKVTHYEGTDGNTYNQVDRFVKKKAPAFEPGKF